MPEHGATYYDRQEVREPAEREVSVFHALPGLLRHAMDNTSLYAERLAGIEPDSIIDRATLASLPVTRKSELADLQRERPIFGGLTATPMARLARVFASPGPVFDPEGSRGDYWRFARAMFAAGFRAGDLVYNTFSYHLTPAGFMVDSGARALGCPVVPAGTGQTDIQVRVINALSPVAYVGTPSFLGILLDRAKWNDAPITTLRRALVSGEFCPPAFKARLAEDYGIETYECYGTADLGLVAYESEGRSGLIADEALILEIVRPGTGDPVPMGEVGELLVTVFNPDYPLLRFATGDLTAQLEGPSPCGRTNMRIKGWLGRADQTTKIRGMFVHPEQIGTIVARHDAVSKARVTVLREGDHDLMLLRCECEVEDLSLVDAIAETARAETGLRATVELVKPGELPDDGKVIDDQRN